MARTERMTGARSPAGMRAIGDPCETKAEDCCPARSPDNGQVAKTQAVLEVLDYCHNTTARIVEAVFPPAPEGCGEEEPCQPSDMTTLLDIALNNIEMLHKRLIEVHHALRG